MSYVGEHNPEWLAKAVFNNSLDWTKSTKTTFPTLLKHVTLHDSYWTGLLLNVYNEVVIVIKLDAFWNKEYTMRADNTDNWPFLIVKINKTINISFDYVEQDMIISIAESKAIASGEIEKLIDSFSESILLPKEYLNRVLDCKQLHKTNFYNLPGVDIEILHDAEIAVLLIEEEGQYIDASLEKAKPFESKPDEKMEKKKLIQQVWNKIKGD